MEIRIYWRILVHKWWIVIPVFLVTLTTTTVLTFTQPPVYTSTATFIVTPNSSFEDVRSFVSGLDVLSRRAEISTTYTEVASSRLVRREAAEELNLSSEQRKGFSVQSKLRAGTNVMEITVEGNDPVLVRDFANMVGAKTMIYLENLYEAYDLRPLDQAALPGSPIKPNKKLNLALGAICGLALSAGLAFLSNYLETPSGRGTSFGIFDDETGVYNRRYFLQRLKGEMSRAKRNQYPLSLAVMDVDHLGSLASSSPQIRSEALCKVAVFLRQYLHEEDMMARLSGSIFAFMLPDTPGEGAKDALEKLQTRMAWTPFEIERAGIKLNLVGAAGVVAYQHNGTSHDELLAKATRALEEAKVANHGKVYLEPEGESWHTNARSNGE
jgi:diguanylate cyclase (GGDEF)-like protein